MSRKATWGHAVVLASAVFAGGCQRANPNSPEGVADAFVDAYFRQMNQEKAKEFTALGATEMLDKELRDVAEIRKDGYTPGQAAPHDVVVKRGEPVPRDQRIRVPYEIHIRTDPEHEVVQDADVELSRIGGTWKVVRLGLKSRS